MNYVKNFLWKFRLFFIKDFYKIYNEIETWQNKSRDEILGIRDQMLIDLIEHSYKNVPYYKKTLEQSEVVINGKVCLENYHKLPLLTKDVLKENFDDLKSTDLDKRDWFINSSGGSTGEPVRFIQEKEYKVWGKALKYLYEYWMCYEFGMKKIQLWGSERDLFWNKEPWNVKLGRFLRNEVWLNSFRMDQENMKSYVETINKEKPVQILSYADAIYELSKFIKSKNLEVHSPDAIMTSAGTLHDEMREIIEEVFEVKVFNRYGTREVGNVACESSTHDGLLIPPMYYVEILDKKGNVAPPGVLGEIVVTQLKNYAMPFLRYKIGDMGVLNNKISKSGLEWPVLEKVTGRITDVFRKSDGGVIVAEYLIHLIGVIMNKDWIRKYQLIQEDYDFIRVLLCPDKKIDNNKDTIKNDLSFIEDKIKLVMGNDCKIEFEFPSDIAPSPSGKYRYTISKVQEI